MDPLAVLDPSANEAYLRWPLPSRRDDEIAGVLDQLVANADLLVRLDGQHGNVLSAFAERMAILAVRRPSTELVAAGLRAAALALATPGDSREALPSLALLYRAAELIGADARAVFLDAAAQLPARLAEPIVAFTERSAEDRSIAAMSYVERHDDDGFRFDRVW